MADPQKEDGPVAVPAVAAEVKPEETKPEPTKMEEAKVEEAKGEPAAVKTEEATAPAVAEVATAPAAAPAADVDDAMEDVPDPDEDDLDDLDDLLDDFSAAKIDSKAPAPATAAPPTVPAPILPPGLEDDVDMEALLNDEDFAKQLQAGMADLIGEIEKSPDVQKQFESLFKEFGIDPNGGGENIDLAAAAAAATGQAAAAHVASQTPPSASASKSVPQAGSSSKSTGAAAGDASFQDTIRRTMERMQASGDQATAAAAADSENTDDMLSEFMKQLQSGGLGGPGSGNEEDLTKMLMGMMEELTNKEILYEPMKELNDKFPAWMEANRSKTSAEDLKRYEEQQVIVREIVTRFELPSYTDTNPEHREYIVDRMQKMQAAGSPPPDLVGDMPSAQEALAVPDESCNQQ
ncbi:Peroxisome chaperone and import receptor [Sporothrix eucalyptigena]|uniref:Peroxisome chaperone and import receptor n=1 Tax=Sporothrix eucalyptigena TaxID=1812306 RepID=A0ABP0C518_9PEZI